MMQAKGLQLMQKQIIAVDLGGTQIRAARYDHDLNLLQRENTLTRAERGPEYAIDRIKAYIAKVMPDCRDDVLGIGISSPGPLNPVTGVIIAPPNLPGLVRYSPSRHNHCEIRPARLHRQRCKCGGTG